MIFLNSRNSRTLYGRSQYCHFQTSQSKSHVVNETVILLNVASCFISRLLESSLSVWAKGQKIMYIIILFPRSWSLWVLWFLNNALVWFVCVFVQLKEPVLNLLFSAWDHRHSFGWKSLYLGNTGLSEDSYLLFWYWWVLHFYGWWAVVMDIASLLCSQDVGSTL